jgi:hypothetical protein
MYNDPSMAGIIDDTISRRGSNIGELDALTFV